MAGSEDTPGGDLSPVVDADGASGLPPQYGGLEEYATGPGLMTGGGPSPAVGLGSGPAPAGTAGHYRVDPERAPEVIAAFKKAADDMRDLQRWAYRLGSIPPPGLDGVSMNAVKEMGEWAMGEQGSLRTALEQGAASLQATAETLEAQLNAFLGAEESNTMGPGGSAL